MKNKPIHSSLLSIVLLIVILSLISSVQNMISPNLQIISYYFDFGGRTAPLGILTSTFTILSGGSIIFFGYLTDKITRKWIVLFGSLFYSIFSIFIIFVSANLRGYFLFFFLTSMNGIAFGAITPSIFSLIGDLISQDDRSKGFSFFSIASLLGIALGLILATLTGPTDWRLSYFIVGILGLVNTILILFFREPSRVGIDFAFITEKETISYTYRIKKTDLKVIFKKKSNIWLIINFIDTIPTGIIMFLIFYYMNDYHNVPGDISLIFLATILISTLIGTIVFGFIGDNLFKKGKRKARVLLALMGNVVPIPLVFIALIIPFKAPDNVSVGELFTLPGALTMAILMMVGMFSNGAVNGSWYAIVVDLNLPEHRGTTLATANFFDIIGRSIGPLIGSIVGDLFGSVYGMMTAIIAWITLPFFWIPVLKNIIPDMEATEKVFFQRLNNLKKVNFDKMI
ncbi:MAG: MFS transporter [Promethearchaeota archaeon]